MSVGLRPRILIVSYWFPPFAAVASLRMGKLAKHLLEHGLDVRVLAADKTGPATMPVELGRERIVYTDWVDVDRFVENFVARLRGTAGRTMDHTLPAVPPQTADTKPPPRFQALRKAYHWAHREIARWPDNCAGWTRAAVSAGDRLIGAWRPDVIFATSPPVTSLIVADRLARRHQLPWVAEFRDLWCDNPYYEYSSLRRLVERVWERRVLGRASAIVSVSPVWLKPYLNRFGKKTITAMNGYVAEDYPAVPPVPPQTAGPLHILYTGHIYAGYRDPGPLFAALRNLGVGPQDVRVEFVGTEIGAAMAAAEQHGVTHLVSVGPQIGYREALARQLAADVLLHMQWCDPRENGTIAGKIFDYIGTRRPILGIGLEDSVVGEMIRTRNAGVVTDDPAKIAQHVAAWMAEKKSGGIAPTPPEAVSGLERSVQFEKVRALLQDLAAATGEQTMDERAWTT